MFSLISDFVNLAASAGEEGFLFNITSFGLKAYSALQCR
jgi:hypothetical protein